MAECIDFCLYLIFPVFPSVDFMRNLFSSALGLSSAEKVLDELTLDGVARYINSGKCESLPAFTLPPTGVDRFTTYEPVSTMQLLLIEPQASLLSCR